uniref:Reverse transcriptase Ty1/copia-type domain-containing protein n=1 Tax=Chromera velia CCMP2878 TaxID=1169474 RepID=A0A0G4FIF6_9ALVE|eukprot:Cvel_17179.t1-p1 / transcript=Cvel_17179.t1 / gene=Cvel_17179 / organism=Chromera_velia_CCMP2878 / gene_product=hypothetical protein / transcript_product=hypothetical protein / location=Cvel_scaffold1357:21720-23008(+) / protein_length=245 / sequence_SO=supercontig / SO=protein_coding / is_pseudo=false
MTLCTRFTLGEVISAQPSIAANGIPGITSALGQSMRLIFQIALDIYKCRGIKLSMKKADITQAYLQADLPPDREVWAIPPPDHPSFGQFLWRLRKAVYGMPDAGKIFEKHLRTVLLAVGWEESLFHGLFFLRGEDGELRGIIATYVDDLFILGLREDASSLEIPIRETLSVGESAEITEERFIGVQFRTTADGSLFTHQYDYVSSMVLLSDAPGTDRRADKPLPVGATHEDDESPLLSDEGVRVF